MVIAKMLLAVVLGFIGGVVLIWAKDKDNF